MKLTTESNGDDPCSRRDGDRKTALPRLLRTSFKSPVVMLSPHAHQFPEAGPPLTS